MTAPTSLNIGAALAGLVTVLAIVVVVVMLIGNTKKKLKNNYSLSGAVQKDYAVSK